MLGAYELNCLSTLVFQQSDMPTPRFLQHHSRFFENLMEHRFLFDLGRELVLRDPPQLLGILKAQVDMDGVDLTLTCAGRIRNIQTKTRSNAPAATYYNISDSVWSADGCILWMIYDPNTLEPISYYLLGCPLPPLASFRSSPKREGYRKLWTRNANHSKMSLKQLATVLFP
jgi:hypothetical protein